jgi:tetratricopeptide (TPR) repeat protein
MTLPALRIHPYIFPEFKKIEKRKQPYLKLGPYAEISLEIFKRLGCQDLHQASLVCKEWKQLIENSKVGEEAYAQALKRAIQKEDVIKEAFCIEKLGDVYAKKETSETLLQAAGLYNYALRRSPCSENNIREKLANVEHSLLKLCQGESLDCVLIAKHFEGNRETLKKFRLDIEAKIQALPETPSFQEVRQLYQEIAQGIKVFFEFIVAQAMATLEPTPCEYAMIGFGSLAREEMTPYSDLEFGILIHGDTPANRDYFKRLTNLLHLKVINLGETILPTLNIPCLKAFFDRIIPRGFAFDGAGMEGKGCKTPFGNHKTFELIQTPEKMAQYIAQDKHGKWWHQKERHLPMELLNFTHLLGSNELTEQYRQKVQENLNTPYQEGLNLRQHLAKEHLVQEDMENFDPRMRDLDRQGMLFKVKNDFYRFPHLALDRLALLKEVLASDTFGRIDQLNKLGVIKERAAEKLKDWMSIVLFMRLKTYSHYQAQQEMMNPLIKPFGFDEPEQFALDQEALEKVKKIYHIFIPFYQAMQAFLAGHENDLTSSDLEDKSLQTQGDIALRLFQHTKAKKCYKDAKKADPKNPQLLSILGIIYEVQGNLTKAAKYAKEALELSLLLFSESSLLVANYKNNLGQIYKEQGDFEQAVEHGKEALKISLEHFVENHPTVSAYCNNLGQIYQAQGNPRKAIECTEKALAIDRQLFDENPHPSVAIHYYNRGRMYKELGNLGKAAEDFKKALNIDLKLFGENHSMVANRYNDLGTIYQAQGNLSKAIEYNNKALNIDLKLLGESPHNVVRDYNSLGMIYLDQEKLDEAAKNIHKVLALYHKFFGRNHSLVATCYNNLGVIYLKQGNPRKAGKYTKQAFEIHLNLLGENHPKMAINYNNQAQIYKEQGDLEKAVDYIKKALTIDRQLFGENHPKLAVYYINLGIIYQEQEKLEKAAEYVEKALEIDCKAFGEKHPRVSTDYIHLGEICKKQCKIEDAIKNLKKGLAIGLEFFDNYHPDMITCYHLLGKIYQQAGKLGKAVEYAKKALVADLKVYGENHPTVAIDYNNLGDVYSKQGNLVQAAEYVCKSLKINLGHFGGTHPKVAQDYNNLGICIGQNDLKEGKYFINKSLNINLKLYGREHFTVASNYDSLAIIYEYKAKLKQACKYFKKALAINQNFYRKSHSRVALNYNNLGRIYQKLGNLKKALKRTNQALKINLKLFGENHPAVATSYNTLGQIYKERGNLPLATKYTKEALRINIGLYGIHHPRTTAINANLKELK